MLSSNPNIVIPRELWHMFVDKLVWFNIHPFANLNILIDSTFNFPCEYFKRGALLMLGYHLFQTKGSGCSCEEPIWLRSKFHNQNCNLSFKVFKISRIETRRFLVPSICGTNIKIGYRVHVFFLKTCGSRQTWQTSVQVTWMGNFFLILIIKTRTKIGLLFFL